MVHFDETHLLTYLREATIRLGRTKVIVATTSISIVMSVIATVGNLYAFGFLDADYITLVSIMLAVLIPFSVALPVSWFTVSIAFSMYQLEAETRKLANYDSLTGLLNRRAFLQAAQALCGDDCDNDHGNDYRYTSPHNGYFAVLILDLDHFKHINDTYGHATGDQVLERFGQIAREVMQPGELAARIGGEEFAFLLPDSTETEAWHFAEQLHQRLRAVVIAKNGGGLRISASIGLIVCAPNVAVETAMNFADKALYRAKANGRNQSVLYRSGPCASAPHRSLSCDFSVTTTLSPNIHPSQLDVSVRNALAEYSDAEDIRYW
ncbi:MAG: GGDEF domain-containing protein [Caldilineaceae bacterium]|nr:GGDEF domain-containing protein [Caldilineaceae bacterium]